LTVRIYDVSGTSTDDLTTAVRTAHGILAAADIAAEWSLCASQVPAPPASRCGLPLDATEVTIRLVRGRAAPTTRGAVGMGEAMVDAAERRGTFATVYTERVAWLAGLARADRHILTGRAIAHEIGHLLMGTTAHSRHGLMRAQWSARELQQHNAGDWLFSPTDARLARDGLADRFTVRDAAIVARRP
jgi:hypothetical protein